MSRLWDYAFQNGWAIWQAYFEGHRSDYFFDVEGYWRIRVMLDDDGEVITAHKWGKGSQYVNIINHNIVDKESCVVAWLCA